MTMEAFMEAKARSKRQDRALGLGCEASKHWPSRHAATDGSGSR
jgi:hypothetical protein